ncbi:MAG: hypothetical protein V7785_04710 [Bermanella sp.]
MFDEHGDYKISVIGNVYLAKFTGSWNLSLTTHYIQDVKKILESNDFKHWGLLLDLTHWGLASPESIELGSQLELFGLQHGMRHYACVFEASVQQHQVEKNISSLSEIIYFKTKSAKEAMEFLTQSGYEITLEEVQEKGFLT